MAVRQSYLMSMIFPFKKSMGLIWTMCIKVGDFFYSMGLALAPWLLFFTIYMIFASTHSNLTFKLYSVSEFWISMCKTRVAPSTFLCSTCISNVYIMRQSKKILKGMTLSSDSMIEHIPEGKEFVFKLNLDNHKMSELIQNYVVAIIFMSDFNLEKN